MLRSEQIQKIAQKSRKKIIFILQNKNFKECMIFLLFLFVSFSFWVMQEGKEQIEHVFSIPVKYESLPPDYILTKRPPKEIKVRVKGEVLNILFLYYSKMDSIAIKLNELPKDNSLKIISYKSFKDKIYNFIGKQLDIVNVTPEEFTIFYNKETAKKVAIKIQKTISFKDGFALSGKIISSPDSIIIYGEKTTLDKIKDIETEQITYEDLNDSVQERYTLQKIEGIRFQQNESLITIPIERYTEKTSSIPIQFLNVPSNYHIVTFPSSIHVSYCVPLSKYYTIDKDDFQFIIDYNDLIKLKNGHRYKLQNKKYPDDIFRIHSSPNEVDFLIEESFRNPH